LRGILYRSIIALSYLISILYSGLKLGGEPKIIGVSGQDTPQGMPDIAVVIQFWFAEENAIPELVIMKKDAFMKFFHVQED
jgi:hypothetical protein